MARMVIADDHVRDGPARPLATTRLTRPGELVRAPLVVSLARPGNAHAPHAAAVPAFRRGHLFGLRVFRQRHRMAGAKAESGRDCDRHNLGRFRYGVARKRGDIRRGDLGAHARKFATSALARRWAARWCLPRLPMPWSALRLWVNSPSPWTCRHASARRGRAAGARPVVVSFHFCREVRTRPGRLRLQAMAGRAVSCGLCVVRVAGAERNDEALYRRSARAAEIPAPRQAAVVADGVGADGPRAAW